MKKTVIIAIGIVYLLSILAVQIFGRPIIMPDTSIYFEKIMVNSVSFANQNDERTIERKLNDDGSVKYYSFDFVAPLEGETYDTTEESLANNPNKVKLSLSWEPKEASAYNLTYIVDLTRGYYDKTTNELTFLDDGVHKITIADVRSNVRVEVLFRVK